MRLAHVPATPLADPARPIPAGIAARIDHIDAALASLSAEERRLMRLGFEIPLHRCREQRRYWRFLAAMFAIADAPAGTGR